MWKSLLLVIVVFLWSLAERAAATADFSPSVVAILPNRYSSYRNRLYNALISTADRLNLTLKIRDYGNYDTNRLIQLLEDAIATPHEQQPAVYCIWPPNNNKQTRGLMRQLYETHNGNTQSGTSATPSTAILQLISLPPHPQDWEYVSAYVGVDSAELAQRGADLLLQDIQEQRQQTGTLLNEPAKVAILGYSRDYLKSEQMLNAFVDRIQQHTGPANTTSPSNNSTGIVHDQVQVVDTRFLPLATARQAAYDAILDMIRFDEDAGDLTLPLDAIYSMADHHFEGVYQALQDLKLLEHQGGTHVTLVGAVCDGTRQLLEDGIQYGTVASAPSLIGAMVMSAAHEFIHTGQLARKLYHIPTVPVQADSWDTTYIEFEDQRYLVDDVCTWNIKQEGRVAGITYLNDHPQNELICRIVECKFISRHLRITSYVLVGLVYSLATICAVLLYKYRQKRVVQLAQPFFLALVLLGTCIDSTSVLFMAPDGGEGGRLSKDRLDAHCATWPWLLALGHMMTTATLVSKMYRVKRVCLSGRNFKRARVRVRDVLGFLVGFLAFDVLILSVWYGVKGPLEWTLRSSSTDANGFITEAYGKCTAAEEHESGAPSTVVFPALLFAGHAVALLYANVLGYQTLPVHKISDSKNIAIALLSSLEFLVLALPSFSLPDHEVSARFLIWTAVICLHNIWVIAFVVCPKLFVCWRGRGDILPEARNSIGSVVLAARFSVGSRSRFDPPPVDEVIDVPRDVAVVEAMVEEDLSADQAVAQQLAASAPGPSSSSPLQDKDDPKQDAGASDTGATSESQ